MPLRSHIIQGQVSVDNLMSTGVHPPGKVSAERGVFSDRFFTFHSPSPKTFNPGDVIKRWAI